MSIRRLDQRRRSGEWLGIVIHMTCSHRHNLIHGIYMIQQLRQRIKQRRHLTIGRSAEHPTNLFCDRTTPIPVSLIDPIG